MKKIVSIAAALLLLLACSKSGNEPPTPNPPGPNPPGPNPGNQGPFDFLKNSEWVGVYHITLPGTSYDPPVCLQFNANNTGITLHSFFQLYNDAHNAIISKDSLKGEIKKIQKVDDKGNPDPNGNGIGIEVSYAETQDNHKIYISPNRDQMTVVTTDAAKYNAIISMNMAPYPAGGHSVFATGWKAKYNDGGAYPDVTWTEFVREGGGDVTRYYRNGKILTNLDLKIVTILYVQRGARVYFSGFNETIAPPGTLGTFVPYFGVLSPDGKEMGVHSISNNKRLPTWMSNAYGPSGSTPVLVRTGN